MLIQENSVLKTIVITGGTKGIGFSVALNLARKNHQLIIIGRNKDCGELAVKKIINETANSNVIYLAADLTSFKSTIDVGNKILSTHASIDILINNAAAFFEDIEFNDAGIEKTFALSYFAPLILSSLFKDKLSRSNGKILNVISGSAMYMKVCIDDIENPSKKNPLLRYAHAKLACVHLTRILAVSWASSGVIVNAVEPGNAATTIYDQINILNQPPIVRIIIPLLRLILRFKSVGAAAASILFAVEDYSNKDYLGKLIDSRCRIWPLPNIGVSCTVESLIDKSAMKLAEWKIYPF
jgi:NAD(P)-dependent dehydrogenase (short-subunit alcohol dehydrogenase family)